MNGKILQILRGLEQEKTGHFRDQGIGEDCEGGGKDRRQWAGNANAVCKHIAKFNKRQDEYEALVSKAKDKEKHSAAELRIWCSV